MIPTNTQFTSYTSMIAAGQSKNSSDSETSLNVSDLGKDEFLTLLLAQLRHQNPLDPASNTEFIAQLAQFSTLEQMSNMNTTLEESMAASSQIAESVKNAMMIEYLGREVTAYSSDFTYDGEGAIDLTFTLKGMTAGGYVEIMDEQGTGIRTLPLSPSGGGSASVTWDGVTSYGTTARAGNYQYRVQAVDIAGEDVGVDYNLSGIVGGVSYRDGTGYLAVGGVLIPIGSIERITENE